MKLIFWVVDLQVNNQLNDDEEDAFYFFIGDPNPIEIGPLITNETYRNEKVCFPKEENRKIKQVFMIHITNDDCTAHNVFLTE